MPIKKELTVREMGQRGGKARGKSLSKKQLSKIGKLGAKKRWAAKQKGGK